MKRPTVFGVILAIILLVFYAGEAYNLIALVLSYTNPLNNGLDIAFSRMLAAYPWWWLLCSFGVIICGVLAPILYVCRSVHSIECAYSACGLNMLLFVLNATFRQSWATVLGNGRGWLLTIVISILTLAFAGYLSSRKEEAYYSNHSGWRFLGSK